MKQKRIFAGIVAVVSALAVLSGCEKEEALGSPEVTLSDKEIHFGSAEDSETIYLTSTLEWHLQDAGQYREWLSITPNDGDASNNEQRIRISVTENKGKERTAEVVFYGNKLKQAKLKIVQAGSQPSGAGTKENPFSASEAKAKAWELNGSLTETACYVKGIVSSFHKEHTTEKISEYGNDSFYISDDGSTTSDQFLCFQVCYLDGAKFTSTSQIAVGDSVTVVGKIYKFGTTSPVAETEGKGAAHVYSHNGNVETGQGGGSGSGEGGGSGTIVEGTNLLTTGGFEKWSNSKPEGWGNLSVSTATVSKSTDAHNGSCSVLIENSTNKNTRFHSDGINLKKGTYTIAVYAKGTGEFRFGYFTKWNNGEFGGDGNDYIYLNDFHKPGSSWAQYSGTFTLAEDSKVSLFISAVKNTNVSICFDDVLLITSDGGLGEGGSGDDGGGNTLADADLEDGQYAIVFDDGNDYYAMKNAISASYYVASTKLPDDGSVDDDCVFTVTKTTGGYTIQNNEGGYVGCEVSGTHYNLRPSLKNEYVWTLKETEEGTIVATGSNSGGNFIVFYKNASNFEMGKSEAECPFFFPIDGGGEYEETYTFADAYYYTYEGTAYWDLNLYGYDLSTFSVLYPDTYVSFEASTLQDSTCIAGTYSLDLSGYNANFNSETDSSYFTSGTVSISVFEEGSDEYYPVYDIAISGMMENGSSFSRRDTVEIYAYSYNEIDEDGYPMEFYLDDKMTKSRMLWNGPRKTRTELNAIKKQGPVHRRKR